MINVDFADVRSVMADAGMGVVTIGRASGADRAIQAAEAALASPLLDIELRAVTGAPPPPLRRAFLLRAPRRALPAPWLFGRPHPLPRPTPVPPGLVYSVVGDPSMSLQEVSVVAQTLAATVDPDAQLIFGASVTADLSDEIVVTLVATGFAPPPPRAGDDDGMRSSGRPQLDGSIDLFDYRPPSTSVLDGREAPSLDGALGRDADYLDRRVWGPQ